MEDPSPVIGQVCDKIMKYEKFQIVGNYIHNVLKLFCKENPEAPINPLYNEWICCMNHYLPQPVKPSQIYYFSRHEAKTWKENVTTRKLKAQTQEHKVKPCIVYMDNVAPTDMHQLLEVCANMNQPVQGLYLYVKHFSDKDMYSFLKEEARKYHKWAFH